METVGADDGLTALCRVTDLMQRPAQQDLSYASASTQATVATAIGEGAFDKSE